MCPKTIVMGVPTVTVGVFKGREPWGTHSQESTSLRRQHLPWVPVAGLRPRMPKTPMDEEANARSQPTNGLPSLQKRSQVRDGAGGRGRRWEGAARSCLGGRLARAVGATVPGQLPPSHTSSSSSCPQVACRQPQAVPQSRQSQASSLHGDRLPRLRCPESSQAAGSRRTQVGSPTETGPNVFPRSR